MTTFDVIISGGSVVDGSGRPARSADVGVRDGVIVAVEPSLANVVAAGGAGEVVDAVGRLVTPGFVDVHTHYDGQATWDEVLEPSTPHGVTTVIMGNCGVGFAPVRPEDRGALIELMEGVEDIPGAALSEGIAWGWESFPEYLDCLGRGRWAVDVGTQLAHGPLRRYVMGPSAADDLVATDDQVADMARLTREAVEAGAFAFTTSRTMGHRAVDGTPVPGTYAGMEELAAITAGVAAGGGRLVEVAGSELARSDDAAVVNEEFDWLGRLSAEHGLPTTFILLQTHDHPDRWRTQLDATVRWRRSGVPVIPLIAGRQFGVIWGWDVRHPFSSRPTYRSIAGLPLAERLVELRHPAVRRRAILSEEDQPATPAEAGQIKYLRRILDECQLISGVPDYEQPRSRSVGALAESSGATMDEVCYDGLLPDGAMMLYALYNYASWDHSVLQEQLEDAEAIVGLADGGAHTAYICDASIPTYMLTHWARDRRRGPRLELPEVVRRLTSQTADLYGLHDRGRVEVGKRADLNVIDHDRLTLHTPNAVTDLPAGGTRLLQPADGYDVTMVAGAITRRHGIDTGARPGRLLRSSSF